MAELEAKAFPGDRPDVPTDNRPEGRTGMRPDGGPGIRPDGGPGNRSDIVVPHVLGCVPELCMLVYVPVEGPYLDEVDDEQFLANLERAARWLARLHGSPVHLERYLQLKAEVVNVRAWSAMVAHRYPEEGDVAAALAVRVTRAIESLPFERAVPIHKDFHYRHLIVDAGDRQRPPRLAVIDFDELRLGEAAVDVGHLCAHLDLLALRRQLPRPPAELQGRFRAAYAEASPGWVPGPALDCFHGYTCLKIAKQLCTTRGVRPRPDGEEERRQVHEILRAQPPQFPPPPFEPPASSGRPPFERPPFDPKA
jgi:hypothetical protein